MHRRSYLAGTSTAALAALAGCAGVLSDGGSGEDSIQATTRWAVPASAPEASLAGYQVRSVYPSEILEAYDEIAPEDVADRLTNFALALRHLDVRDLERFVEVDPAGHSTLGEYYVFEGEFDATAVIEALEEGDTTTVERVGSHGEYEIYRIGTAFAVYAVAGGTIVEADGRLNGEVEPADVEPVLDAAAGETDRITDQHEGLGATADELDPSHHVGLVAEDPEQTTDFARSQFTGAVAIGSAAEILGEEIELRTLVTFESEQARETAPLDEWIEEARAETPTGEITKSEDGRFVDVTVTLPTSRFY